MTRKFARCFAPIALLMLCASPGLKAQTIAFTDFNPTAPNGTVPPSAGFNTTAGQDQIDTGFGTGAFRVVAQPFILAGTNGTWQLNQLYAAVYNNSATNTLYDAFIFNNAGGLPTGAPIGDFTGNAIAGLPGASPATVSLALPSSGPTVNLIPGVEYWLAVEPTPVAGTGANSTDLWYNNSLTAGQGVPPSLTTPEQNGQFNGGSGWAVNTTGTFVPIGSGASTQLAFQMNGALVPEGDSLLYLCSGGIPFGVLHLFRRFRKRAA